MAKQHIVVIMGVVAAFICEVAALSDEEKDAIRADLIPILAECGKNYEITKEDVIAAKESKDIDALNSCFYACILKKKNIINEDGLYAPDVAKSEHAKLIHDETLLKQLDEVSDSCASVNDQTVSDGAEGCERAKMVVTCMADHKDVLISAFKE